MGLSTTGVENPFLTEKGKEPSYLKMAFHESHIIGYWCHMGPQNLLIQHKLSNSDYTTTVSHCVQNGENDYIYYVRTPVPQCVKSGLKLANFASHHIELHSRFTTVS